MYNCVYFLYIAIAKQHKQVSGFAAPKYLSCLLHVLVCVIVDRDSVIWYQSQFSAIAISSRSPSKPSRSPPRRRGRSHSRRHSGSRVIKRSSANIAWPMLTRTNYSEWALVMQVNYQTLHVWDVVEHEFNDDDDEDEYQQDR